MEINMGFNKSDNSIDFNTLCVLTKSEDEFTSYFTKFSISMERLHNKGYYITDFNPSNIIYNMKKEDFSLDKARSNNIKEDINRNIRKFADMIKQIDSYYGLNIGRGYVDSINDNDASYYFHEYLTNLDKASGNNMSNTKAMVKATPAGIMYSSAEDNNDTNIDLNKAAFVSVPFAFVMAAVIIVLMLIIYFVV